ncbi:MAG: peptidylprolyl isomerase [Steroidobacteraceae bacterium]
MNVDFETSHGSFTVELFTEQAPKTAANFLQYVDEGHFDGTVFHRVIPGFVIQGGGLTSDLQQKPTHPPVENEAGNGLKNERGSLSMARTNDPDSATAQFFVNLADNEFLNPRAGQAGYAVFGRVSAGMDVIDRIATVKTGRRKGHEDVPAEDIQVVSARRA